MEKFKAMLIEETENGFTRNIIERSTDDLQKKDVCIRVLYSSLNYKDALSATGNKGITRKYPHTPGIDAAGIVVRSNNNRFSEGDEVICTGYDLGMNTEGGWGQYISVPAEWIVPKPSNLSLKKSMIIGTAGFTAMNGVMDIINHEVKPEDGKVLVTGATGGVGIMAVTLLSKLGYEVVAVSGKAEYYDMLKQAGTKEIIDRGAISDLPNKPLLPQEYIAAIDTVGGNVLANVIKSTMKYGIVTTCGSVISNELNVSIFPFILRGVRLVGLASAETYMKKRLAIWEMLNEHFANYDFDFLAKEVNLENLNPEIDLILKSKQCGRILVNLE